MKSVKQLALAAILLAPVSGAEAAEYNWRYVGVINAAHDYAQMMIAGFERVEERTDGALHIEYVTYGETPYKAVDALTLTRDGLVDMTEWVPGYNASTYPLLGGPELPFVMKELLDAGTFQEEIAKAWQTPTIKAYKQGILDDHGAVSLLSAYYDPLNIWFSESVSDLEGMAGKKVRATAPEQAEFLMAAGASPVNISAAEAYTGLQRGVIDGIITGAGAVVSFKWDEVLESGFATNVLLLSFDMLVSKEKLEELPQEARQILIEEMAAVEKEIRDFMPKYYEAKLAQLEKQGMTIVKPSPELYTRFHEIAVENVYPQWVQRAGPEAETLLSEFGIELQ